MFVRNGRGMGVDASQCTSFFSWALNSDCWGHSIPYWQQAMIPGGSGLAVPAAPTGSVLTTPPASGADAQATVDALLNEQLAAQQVANAAQVQPVTDIYSLFNSATGGMFAGGGGDSTPSPGFSVPWWAWAVGGGIFLVAAFGGRR
jgi:hypothetical protein